MTTFGEILNHFKIYGKCWSVSLIFSKILNLRWPIFYATWLLIVVNGQILNKQSNHLVSLTPPIHKYASVQTHTHTCVTHYHDKSPSHSHSHWSLLVIWSPLCLSLSLTSSVLYFLSLTLSVSLTLSLSPHPHQLTGVKYH